MKLFTFFLYAVSLLVASSLNNFAISANSTDNGYRFKYNIAYLLYDYASGTYDNEVTGTGIDYTHNTNFFLYAAVLGSRPTVNTSFGYLPLMYAKDIIVVQANFGSTPWEGAALPYVGGSNHPCVDSNINVIPGACGKTFPNQPDRAHILINNTKPAGCVFPLDPEATLRRNFLVRHEVGHILGLGHSINNSTPPISIMSGACESVPAALFPPEINTINSWY